jgi:hydroxymethylbilane synthase
MNRAMNASAPTPLRAGTRGSPLALVQTRTFIRLLAAVPGAPPAVETIISVTGDAVLDRPLAEIGGKGLFAKEIHEALLDGRVDLAVHSLKDLETELPRGIVLGCVLKREDCRDALILSERCEQPKARDPLAALPMGAAVGTSSVRRQAQLLHVRPDLKVVGMRGNVQTRLSKLRDGQCDATTLALAGLRRLGLDLPNIVVLEPETMVPAAGQGIVGVTACGQRIPICWNCWRRSKTRTRGLRRRPSGRCCRSWTGPAGCPLAAMRGCWRTGG